MSGVRVTLLGLAALVAAVSLGACAYLQHPKSGTYPEGDRRHAMDRSPHFVDGAFRNLVDTPMFADDSSSLSVVVSDLLQRVENLQPERHSQRRESTSRRSPAGRTST